MGMFFPAGAGTFCGVAQRRMHRGFSCMSPWKYDENTFLSVTTGNFKLMNILIADHTARIAQAVTGVNPPDSDFTTMQGRLTPVKAAWDAAYNGWIAARGTYKGKTQGQEGAANTASTAVEAQRIASANVMYQNLGRLMEKFVLVPTKIEDYFDMTYIRDGASAPPEVPPVPPVPPTP